LLIAGKGHENQQLIGDETLPFSDEGTVRAILRSQAAGETV
jgi:UDP-N-acetylmuramyl tripeptide synthase